MSRIGKNPVSIPQGVDVNINDNIITVKGKLGELKQEINDIEVNVEDNVISFERSSEKSDQKAKHGLYRALVNNMIEGVTNGFTKELELVGVGYRAKMEGSKLNLTLGFSHPVSYQIPEGIKVTTPTQTEISIKGVDKQKVGQVAAELRSIRPPEPYKGKGVRYKDEKITLKETKKQV